MTTKDVNDFCRGILIAISVASLMVTASSAVSIESSIDKWATRHERGSIRKKKEQPPKLILEATPEVKASE